MIYRLQDGKILPHGEAPLAPDGRYIGLGSLEASSPLFPCSLPSDLFEKSLANPATRFESREGLDVICLEVWDKRAELPFSSYRVHLFLQKDEPDSWRRAAIGFIFFYKKTGFRYLPTIWNQWKH